MEAQLFLRTQIRSLSCYCIRSGRGGDGGQLIVVSKKWLWYSGHSLAGGRLARNLLPPVLDEAFDGNRAAECCARVVLHWTPRRGRTLTHSMSLPWSTARRCASPKRVPSTAPCARPTALVFVLSRSWGLCLAIRTFRATMTPRGSVPAAARVTGNQGCETGCASSSG